MKFVIVSLLALGTLRCGGSGGTGENPNKVEVPASGTAIVAERANTSVSRPAGLTRETASSIILGSTKFTEAAQGRRVGLPPLKLQVQPAIQSGLLLERESDHGRFFAKGPGLVPAPEIASLVETDRNGFVWSTSAGMLSSSGGVAYPADTSLPGELDLKLTAISWNLVVSGIADDGESLRKVEFQYQQRTPPELESCGCVTAESAPGEARLRLYDDGWRLEHLSLRGVPLF